ncbi:hypothetical protein [Bacillus phage BC-T25]|nr:hypothetical protein [Bacillus phage BC-T25]
MSAYQITIITIMSISGGIIGYLAARLNQEKNKVKLLEAKLNHEKNKVKLLEALKNEYKGQILMLEECRRVAGEVSYDTMINKLSKDLAEEKITYGTYKEELARVNRVYGRE